MDLRPHDHRQENAVIFHKDLKGVFSYKISVTCVSVNVKCGRFCPGWIFSASVKRLECRASDFDELKKINNPSHGTHLKLITLLYTTDKLKMSYLTVLLFILIFNLI